MVDTIFTGGDKLKAKLREIAKKLDKAHTLNVGWPESATEEDHTPCAMIMAIQEYGAPNAQFPIPPRPFFRKMIEENSDKWGDILIGALIESDMDAHNALDALGLVIKEDLQESIRNVQEPALSPTTLMLRKMKRLDKSLKVTRATVIEAQDRVAKDEDYKDENAKPLMDTLTCYEAVQWWTKD